MDALEQLMQILMETPDETPAPAREIRSQRVQQKLLDAWRNGDTDSWQELLFVRNLVDENAHFDQLDREVGAPVGTMREAWEMARARA